MKYLVCIMLVCAVAWAQVVVDPLPLDWNRDGIVDAYGFDWNRDGWVDYAAPVGAYGAPFWGDRVVDVTSYMGNK
jgi:hypothetical protein